MENTSSTIKCYQNLIFRFINLSFNFNYVIGSKRTCNVCGHSFNSFIPWRSSVSDVVGKYKIIGSDLQNYGCFFCGANDRLRHLYLYFDNLGFWAEFDNKNILHIAPEKQLYDVLISKAKTYVAGDLFPDSNNKFIQKTDVTNLYFENESFDLIICNHVLEHVPDDIIAMEELYRVLKKGGKAILQTPYSEEIFESYEDKSIKDEKGRLENFGQEDHVRIYGLDFFEKLKSVGFNLNIVHHFDLFNDEDSYKYGINPREDLIMVSK